jgi:hypothetical protein
MLKDLGIYERDIDKIIEVIGEDFKDTFELKNLLLANKDKINKISFISRFVIKSLSNAALRSLGAQGTNIIVANGPAAGQKAQHFMIHIIPRKENDSLSFNLPQKQIDEATLEQLREKVSQRLYKLLGKEMKQEQKQPVPKPIPPAEQKKAEKQIEKEAKKQKKKKAEDQEKKQSKKAETESEQPEEGKDGSDVEQDTGSEQDNEKESTLDDISRLLLGQ